MNAAQNDPHLSPAAKRELLANTLRERARAKTVVAPLSHGQRALWFLYRSAPESAAYHVSFSARIHSPLDIDALRRACQALLDRHSALRARFLLKDGEPVQEISSQCSVRFTHTDCGGDDEAVVRERVAAAYRMPFDLEIAPALRVAVFTLNPRHHVLLLTVHHIVYDAWSLWQNLDELRQLYAAATASRKLALPPATRSYRDFIRTQRELLAGEAGERLWNYWRRELAGDLPVLALPIDRPRPAVQTYSGASQRFNLGPKLTLGLRKLAQAEGATPFMLLLAAFQVLLHRYSGQDEILIGSPTSGRGNGDFAQVTGYFVNPVVLRARLADNPPFAQFLQQVAKTVVNALEHQDLPFPLVVERLQPRRDPRYAPLFQASFVYQKPQRASATAIDWLSWMTTPGARVEWGGLDIEFFDQPQQEGQFDLELEALDSSDTLHGAFKYNTDLFSPATIAGLSQSFAVLLAGIVENSATRIDNLALVSGAEAEQLLTAQPRRRSSRATLHALHHSFEFQVAANPNNIAVTCGTDSLTYAALNRHANRLAHTLIELGVQPEMRVGICLERSWKVPVAMLAAVKAGAVYVPIAPEAPAERNAFIMEDSDIAVLITQTALVKRFGGVVDTLIDVDADWSSIQKQSARNPAIEASLDRLLYIIYTSGSTGRPKGAEVTHANVARLFATTAEWFRFGPDDVWTLFHSFAFDFSVWEIWGALLYGGRVVVVPYLLSRSPDEFVDLLNREGVTILNQTPSAFRQLMDAEERRPLRADTPLRAVIFGGEALDLGMLRRWYTRHEESRPRLVNMYGITETTVHVSYRPLCAADLDHGRSVIGQPLPDLQIHVLDNRRQPVPALVPGEIYVAGDGLCRGYWRRDELTAERFVTLELGSGGGVRAYRTGDLARRLPDGDIEYLGRIDEQVKIRGFRIELGEIEAALAQCRDVKAAVVIVRTEHDDKRLVAYVVGAQNGAVSPAALREQLLLRLPDYMVPVAFVMLDALPLNSNGKIDRRALPVPESLRNEVRAAFIPPRDTVEQALLRQWETVLNVRPIGVRDNFFDLGGHSLLAVNLLARVEQDFNVTLPLATLFSRPTVELLGEALREQVLVPTRSALVPVQTAGTAPPFFCVAGGGGSVLYYYALANRLGADRPFYGLQGIGLDGECEPPASVEALAQIYIKEIRAVQAHGPYLLGGHCFGGLVAFEMSQQLRRDGEAVALLVLMDVPARQVSGSAAIPSIDDAVWIVKFAAVAKESAGVDLCVTEAALGPLDATARLQFLNERMQAAGFLPPGANLSKVRGMLRVFASNSTMRYAPNQVLPVPIALFRAGEFHADYDFSPADDSACTIERSTLGWSDFADGEVAVHVVSGNHITMLSEPHVEGLARRIAACLADLETQYRAADAILRPDLRDVRAAAERANA